MNRQTFEQCPRRTIQARPITNTYTYEPDMLWRTAGCAPDRWHYWQNPCNCHHDHWAPSILGHKIRTPRDFYANVLGWPVVIAQPETGTWKRDGSGIASIARTFREEIRARRETQTVAYAAVGPREPALTFMGVQVYWDEEYDSW